MCRAGRTGRACVHRLVCVADSSQQSTAATPYQQLDADGSCQMCSVVVVADDRGGGVSFKSLFVKTQDPLKQVCRLDKGPKVGHKKKDLPETPPCGSAFGAMQQHVFQRRLTS